MPGYAVIISKPASEEIAERRLREEGYRSYLPVCWRVLKGNRPGKGERVKRPLFPRYLFCELDADEPWRAILHTSGVSNIILAGERPYMLSAAIVEDIRERERREEFDDPRPGQKRADLIIGSEVQITDGPFAGYVAELQSLDGPARARVLLRAMGIIANVGTHTLKVVA